MPKRTTTATLRVSEEWGSLIRGQIEAQKSQSIYRIQPVSLDEFVTSPDYLNQGMWGMSQAQREFISIASDFENGINLLVLWVGKGGGKNWAAAVTFLYAAYKLLCMYDPHRYLDHNRAKAITFANVAINASQARDNFFEPLVEMVRNAGPRAFREFGFNERDIFTNYILLPQNIQILSLNSAAGGIEGYDILLGLADEVDDVEFKTADRIIDTLRTSAQSRFIGKEKVIVISYSRYEGSTGRIKDYYERYQGMPHVFVRRYASWEFHPKRDRSFFQGFFDEHPEKAACIYGSQVSGSYVDSWLKDHDRLKRAMTHLGRTWIMSVPVPTNDWKKDPYAEINIRTPKGDLVKLDPYRLPIHVPGNPNHTYVFVGDPAIGDERTGGDGYGIALGHRELVKNAYGDRLVRPVIDLAFRFTGRMFVEGQVQFAAIEELIILLKEKLNYNIRIFSFDGWNSAHIAQWCARRYPGALVYDRALVETRDYTLLRDAIFGEAPPSDGQGRQEDNGGIGLFWHPILYDELRSLREDRTKSPPRVDHPPGGSKDIADCVAKIVRICHEWPISELRTSVGAQPTGEDLWSELLGIGRVLRSPPQNSAPNPLEQLLERD